MTRRLVRAVLPVLACCVAFAFQPAALAEARASTPPMTFTYGPGETQRWYNAQHPQPERLARHEAAVLAKFLNGVVWGRVVRYLRAVTPDCRPGDPAECERLVRMIASRYGVDPTGAANVARCESGFNPEASNGGRFLGMFQQMASAWAGRASARGFGGRSAFDPVANTSVSMMMVREDGGWGQWECQP